jgi:hypothetical protein
MGKSGQYEILSPWAEVDEVPVRGISPRLKELKNVTIGLFDNGKPKARPMLMVVEKIMREKYPEVMLDWYEPVRRYRYHVVQTASENKPVFEEWVKKVDAVIAAVGD